MTSPFPAEQSLNFKFKVGDIVKEANNNSIYRYKIASIESWPAGWGFNQEFYQLNRQETDMHDIVSVVYSRDFVESTFVLVTSTAGECTSHVWQTYNSGWVEYDYCTGCNVRKGESA